MDNGELIFTTPNKADQLAYFDELRVGEATMLLDRLYNSVHVDAYFAIHFISNFPLFCNHKDTPIS